MADNTLINAGSGGDTVASDELTTLNGAASTIVKVQRMKVGFGSDNVLRDVDAQFPLPVGGGFVSVVNSTAVALVLNGVFTGTSEDVSQFASISVIVFASHISATDGLSMQQSTDGTNWDNLDAYTIPATVGKSFGIQVTAKFFRVVYTNGAVAQTAMRLQTIYHNVATPASSVRPQDGRPNDNDMQEVLGHTMIYNGTTWDRARGSNGIANVAIQPVTLAVTATGLAAAAVTATLPAPAAGLFHYISRINIVKYATTAITGVAAPVLVTSTNLPGTVAWTTPTGQAIGTVYETDVEPTSPIRSAAAATATTIVAPVQTAVIWRITVYYYTAA